MGSKQTDRQRQTENNCIVSVGLMAWEGLYVLFTSV